MSAAGDGEEEHLQQSRDRGGGGLHAAELEGDAIPEVGNGGVPWMLVLSFVFLTFNSALALYRSLNDPWNAAFILATYADLLALFLFLRRFETTPEASIRQRANLKMWIWVLCSALVVMFSHRVAGVMPFPIVVLIWILAALTTAGGFYGLFIYDGRSGDESKDDDEKPLKV